MPPQKQAYAHIENDGKLVSIEVYIWAPVEDEQGNRSIKGMMLIDVSSSKSLSDYKGFKAYYEQRLTGLEMS